MERKKTIEFYKDKKAGYRWRTISSNGNITADSAEGNGYKTLRECVEGWTSVFCLGTYFKIDTAFKDAMDGYNYKVVDKTKKVVKK